MLIQAKILNRFCHLIRIIFVLVEQYFGQFLTVR